MLGIQIFCLTNKKIFIGHASNTTFIPNVFLSVSGGPKYMLAPFPRLFCGAMAGLPPPLDPSVRLSVSAPRVGAPRLGPVTASGLAAAVQPVGRRAVYFLWRVSKMAPIGRPRCRLISRSSLPARPAGFCCGLPDGVALASPPASSASAPSTREGGGTTGW